MANNTQMNENERGIFKLSDITGMLIATALLLTILVVLTYNGIKVQQNEATNFYQINQDLQGLKMRVPGFAGEVMAKLGLSVTNIAPGELYTSLERGTIDALEWVGPGMDISMGFHKIAPYYYTGWHEPATELQFLVNEKSFEKLPKDYQQILLTAMRVSAYDMYIQNYDMSAKAWSTMLTEFPDIKVKTFPKDVMDAMKKANADLLEEVKKESPIVKEVLESQEAYQKQARKWTEMSDFLYLKDNL